MKTLRLGRRRWMLGLGTLAFGAPREARADAVRVPPGVQADLTAKVLGFDRSYARRAGSFARVLAYVRPRDARSEQVAAQYVDGLSQEPTLAGIPHGETIVPYVDATEVATSVRAQRASIVFLSSGLASEAEGVARALDGVSVLSVGAEPMTVARGLVLGFDLVSGKPRLLVNVSQARRQYVDFSAALLRLATTYA